jgi:RNA polymerase sigma factor (sigma-70 family)
MIKSPTNDIPDDWHNRLLANDEQFLKFIYQSNYHKIAGYVMDNSGTHEDAKDIYQEAFVAVWRNLQLGKVSFVVFDHVKGYLFRIAQHKWIDELRKRKKQTVTLQFDKAEQETAWKPLDPDDEDYLQRVETAYAAMGEPCRQLLNRFYFQKQPLRDIAAAFSWTEATAKNNKYRCLQKLRNFVFTKTE